MQTIETLRNNHMKFVINMKKYVDKVYLFVKLDPEKSNLGCRKLYSIQEELLNQKNALEQCK